MSKVDLSNIAIEIKEMTEEDENFLAQSEEVVRTFTEGSPKVEIISRRGSLPTPTQLDANEMEEKSTLDSHLYELMHSEDVNDRIFVARKINRKFLVSMMGDEDPKVRKIVAQRIPDNKVLDMLEPNGKREEENSVRIEIAKRASSSALRFFNQSREKSWLVRNEAAKRIDPYYAFGFIKQESDHDVIETLLSRKEIKFDIEETKFLLETLMHGETSRGYTKASKIVQSILKRTPAHFIPGVHLKSLKPYEEINFKYYSSALACILKKTNSNFIIDVYNSYLMNEKNSCNELRIELAKYLPIEYLVNFRNSESDEVKLIVFTRLAEADLITKKQLVEFLKERIDQ